MRNPRSALLDKAGGRASCLIFLIEDHELEVSFTCCRSSGDAHQVCWPVLQAWFIKASVLPGTEHVRVHLIHPILGDDLNDESPLLLGVAGKICLDCRERRREQRPHQISEKGRAR